MAGRNRRDPRRRRTERLKTSRCRTCKKPIELEGQYFPFCSERCRLVDLGRWLDGSYAVPIAESPEDDEPGDEPEDGDPEPRPGKPT